MGSLLPISLPLMRPFLKPARRITPPGRWPWELVKEQRRLPTPEFKALTRWMREPPDLQSRMRRRQLAPLPPWPWMAKRRRRR